MMPQPQVTMIKVFSETKHRERNRMGETVTGWLLEHPELCITDRIVTQSSDSEFHCLTITLFLRPSEQSARLG